MRAAAVMQASVQAKKLTTAQTAIAFMAVTLLGNIYPRPPAPYSWMPLAYAGCLAAGPLWLAWRKRGAPGLIEEIQRDLELAGPAAEVL